MKLLADSGSTKTEWVIIDHDGKPRERFITSGLNPTIMPADDVKREIVNMCKTHVIVKNCNKIEFYGSGCTPEASPLIVDFFKKCIPSAESIIVDSDIIGAAKSLFGNNEGIACILGTGSNSCVWDGNKVIANTPCLGFILGDEGGGASLGKSFINMIYKRGSNEKNADGSPNKLFSLCNKFEKVYNTSKTDVINRTYKQPAPNRWLASIAPFIKEHCNVDEVNAMVTENFVRFFRYNIVPYNRRDLPIGFVGSIAYHFRSQLIDAAKEEGFNISNIKKSPL